VQLQEDGMLGVTELLGRAMHDRAGNRVYYFEHGMSMK